MILLNFSHPFRPNPPSPFPTREGGGLPSPARRGAGGEVNLPSPERGGARGGVYA